jgi:hypothetical protein
MAKKEHRAGALRINWSRRRILGTAGIAVWTFVLLGVAIPSLRRTVAQHRQIIALEKQLADLDEWSVAGLWLEKSLGARQAVIDPQWERLFPPRRAKEEFFLDLARVADRSGVGGFELRELEVSDPVPVEADPESASAAGGGEIVPLSSYRVQASFQGHYEQVAQFLGGLKEINRAVAVHNLAIKPSRGAVQVDLELDVYVSKIGQS